ELRGPRAGPHLPQGRVEQRGLHPGLSGREGRARHAHGAGAQRALLARSFLRAVLLVPWVIPTVITALTWHWMFNALWGLINVTLQGVGLQREPIAWLGQPATAMAAVITANVWRGFPFFGVSLLAGM